MPLHELQQAFRYLVGRGTATATGPQPSSSQALGRLLPPSTVAGSPAAALWGCLCRQPGDCCNVRPAADPHKRRVVAARPCARSLSPFGTLQVDPLLRTKSGRSWHTKLLTNSQRGRMVPLVRNFMGFFFPPAPPPPRGRRNSYAPLPFRWPGSIQHHHRSNFCMLHLSAFGLPCHILVCVWLANWLLDSCVGC